MPVFSLMIDGDQIEEAFTAFLKLRYGTYLDEIAEQRGRPRGTYQHPKSWVIENDFDKWPDDALPCVLVISPGIEDEPKKSGNGNYRAVWFVATAVIVRARNRKDTRKVAMRYGAALRTCVLENRSLGGALEGKMRVKDWVSEDYDDISDEDNPNLFAAKNIFRVEVDDVVNVNAGPTEWLDPVGERPNGDPISPSYEDWPTVDPEQLEADVTFFVDVDEDDQGGQP